MLDGVIGSRNTQLAFLIRLGFSYLVVDVCDAFAVVCAFLPISGELVEAGLVYC